MPACALRSGFSRKKRTSLGNVFSLRFRVMCLPGRKARKTAWKGNLERIVRHRRPKARKAAKNKTRPAFPARPPAEARGKNRPEWNPVHPPPTLRQTGREKRLRLSGRSAPERGFRPYPGSVSVSHALIKISRTLINPSIKALPFLFFYENPFFPFHGKNREISTSADNLAVRSHEKGKSGGKFRRRPFPGKASGRSASACKRGNPCLLPRFGQVFFRPFFRRRDDTGHIRFSGCSPSPSPVRTSQLWLQTAFTVFFSKK